MQPLLSLFLLFYGVSSFATIWYENNVVATLAMGLNFIAYIFLIVAVLPKVHFKKMNTPLTIVFLLLVIINGYLLYEFIQMIKDFTLSKSHYLITLIGAMSLVLLGFLALLYNYIYSTKPTLIFTFFVMSIIFSEIFRATAYYEFAYGNIAVYTARALLLIGLSLMVHYEMAAKKENELLSNGFRRPKLRTAD
jgi:hypothetical protein